MDNLETAKCWGREDGRSKLARIVPAEHEWVDACVVAGSFPTESGPGSPINRMLLSQCVHCKELKIEKIGQIAFRV
jgi:hypothetical protein